MFSEISHSPDNPVFPGYYCWWEVSGTEWYRGDSQHGEHLTSVTQTLQRQGIEVAEYVAYDLKFAMVIMHSVSSSVIF